MTTIHILVELICFLVIFLYIRRNVRKLQNQIDDLTSIIQQQQEMLHVHHKILNNDHIHQPSISINTTDEPSFEVFHIPISVPPPPPSQTIIEEQTPPLENHEETPKPLTEEAIEQELVEEMQELKQEEEKQGDEEEDDSSPSSNGNKKKNRRRH